MCPALELSVARRQSASDTPQPSGPGVAASSPHRREGKGPSGPSPVTHGSHEDFLRKCRHVRSLLAALDAGSAAELGDAWTLVFADDGDPTYAVQDWFEAGWRDPLLAGAALRICGCRTRAEQCMALLGRDPGERYHHDIVAGLACAMIAAGAPS